MIHKGSCLCGGVAFEVHGDLRPVIFCHSTQCRKQTGHYLAATSCALKDFRLIRADSLAWYKASPAAKRGFCNLCGSTMFWQPEPPAEAISITPGVFDGPTGLKAEGHIYCADKGDYYEIPTHEGYRKQQWED